MDMHANRSPGLSLSTAASGLRGNPGQFTGLRFRVHAVIPSLNSLWVIMLVLAVMGGTLLRIGEIQGKKTISHDEGISYLAAAGSLGLYQQATSGYPSSNWVRASEWKQLLRPGKPFAFKRIGSDLANYDIHPPLYFWLLHVWTLIFGAKLWTGTALNTVIALVATLSLFGLAHEVLRDSLDASLVAYTWALSPAVVSVSFDARPYDLLALAAIFFVWLMWRQVDLTKRFGLYTFALLAIVTAAGALTHYYFVLVVLGGVGFASVKLFKTNLRRLASGFLSLALGYAIFFLLHPRFYLSFVRQRTQAQTFTYEDLAPRIKTVASTLLSFFGEARSVRLTVVLLIIVGCVLLLVRLRKSPRMLAGLNATVSTEYSILYFFLWAVGVAVFPYLIFLAPRHAMGPKYLSIAWPFFAFLPILALRLFPKLKVGLSALFCVGLLLSSIAFVVSSNYINNRNPDPAQLLASSDHLVVDNLARGVFPRIFWHVPDDKLVFAASQHHLLRKPGDWLSQTNGGSVYVSELSYGNTAKRQTEILGLITREHRIIPVEGGIWGVGDAFKIQVEKERRTRI